MNIDNEAIAEYLTIGYTLDWKTFEEGKKYKPRNMKFPKLKTRPDVTIADVKRELKNYFMKFAGKKVAVMLSGGKDSRLVVEMCNSLGLDATAITIGYRRDSRENIIAEKVSSALGIPHMFLELKPEIYSEQNLRQSILFCEADPTSLPFLTHYYYRDTLSNFDVVFEGHYLTTSLREDRFYQPKDNMKRLLRAITFDSIIKEAAREKVKQRLILQNENEMLNEMCLQEFKDALFKKFDITKNLFNLEWPNNDENVLNAIWSLPDKGTVKAILKKYDYGTRRLPCTRSPFPLYFPWIIHYGYKYLKNLTGGVRGGLISNADMGPWCGYEKIHMNIVKNLAGKLSLPDSLGLEFLDNSVVKRKIERISQRRDYASSIERLVRVKIWLEEAR
ncbi:MAG: hypothetical protein J7L19_05315 [Dehalococcoidia bacterium]|nr:hypothetical protein [Dehalococcoidia bacterium]